MQIKSAYQNAFAWLSNVKERTWSELKEKKIKHLQISIHND